MFRWYRAALERRRAIRRDAEALIGEFGADAWEQARGRIWQLGAATEHCDSPEWRHRWDVARAVERRLGISHQPDTATRYFEGDYTP